MFNQQTVTNEPGNAPNNAPLTVTIIDKMNGIQSEHSGLLHEIESKLHNIVNLRTPEKESNAAQPRDISTDFATTLGSEITKMYITRDRLEKILKHLSQII